MSAIDVCFFVERTDRRLADRLLEPYSCERAEVDRYQEGCEALTRYVVRLWSEKIAQELFDDLAQNCIRPSSDLYFSVPDDPVAEADIYDLLEDFLPAALKIEKKIYDAFLPGTIGKTKVLGYDIFLASPEEEKRAVAENFAERLRASGVVPEGRHWYVYIPKYLPC
jgi:hypothetical protein